MAKQIRLRFNRNTDVKTEYYYIYRHTTSGVSSSSPRIMKVKQLIHPNPLDVENEHAVMVTENVCQLHHINLFRKPVSLTINGALIPENTYIVDYEEGYIYLDNPAPLDAEVSASYTFDGIEVIDDAIEQDLVLQYYGPPAEDLGNVDPPKNMSITPNMVNGDIRLDYEIQDSKGQYFYYKVEARNEDGDYSYLSNEMPVYLKSDVQQVIVERLNGNGKWERSGSSTEAHYIDGPIDKEPPETLKGVAYEVIPKTGTGTSDIDFAWSTPLTNNKISSSSEYRTLTQLKNGTLSQPSDPVGPAQVQSQLNKIVIRRKVYDGSYPTLNGPDAITVAEITDLTLDSFTDTIPSNEEYAYSLFVIDKAGNVSPAVILTIFVESTIPPGAVTATASIHNLII